jgi:hypothetical protein
MYIHVYPCFPFHYSQRAVLVLLFTFASQGTGYRLHVQYNMALFGHLGLEGLSGYSDTTWVIVVLFESALVYTAFPRPYLGDVGDCG